MSASARSRAAVDYIKGLRGDRAAGGADHSLRTALAIGAVLGAVVLVVAEFSTLYDVVIGSLETPRRSVGVGENHAYALLVVALVSVPMALGAARGARPPAFALVALGAVALFIALAVDLPETRQSGRLAESVAFEDAQAQVATGFYLETLGAVVLLFAGGALLLLGRGAQPGRELRSDRAGDQ